MTEVKGNVISTLFYISHLGKENVIFRLPWLERVNPIIDWAEKTLEIDPKQIRKPTKSQTIDRALQVCRVDLERKKMRSKEVFAEGLRNLHPRKKPMVSIEEIPDEEAVHIAVNKLPDQYEDMPALVPDTKDDEEEEEETIEGDLLIAYLQGESMKQEPEEREPLNQPIQVDNGEILIRAKTSISQSLVHGAETKERKPFESLVPKEYHEY